MARRRRHAVNEVPEAQHADAAPIVSVAPPRLEDWVVVNDGVMGGRSDGRVDADNGHLVFSGTLNTHGGGFASTRSQSLERSLALPFSAFEPTWRGDSLRNRGVPLDTEFHTSARSVGFTIADKRDGAFRLEVGEIGAY